MEFQTKVVFNNRNCMPEAMEKMKSTPKESIMS
jgi:hypothetical protein